MKCPRTGANMKEVEINGIKLDVSEGCAGVWFDNFEFQKFDEARESAGDQLIGMLEKTPEKEVDLDQRISCPRCPNTVMMRHFASPLRKIQIDKCPACGGMWLDAGELAHYRKLFPTQQDLEKVREEFIAKTIMPLLKAEAAKEQAKLQEAQRVAGALRFICPSHYIPGKQNGAAF